MAKYGNLNYDLPIIVKVQCINIDNALDAFTGSGHVWQIGEVNEMPEKYAKRLIEFDDTWAIVDGEPLTVEEIKELPHNQVTPPNDFSEDDEDDELFQAVDADFVPEELISSDQEEHLEVPGDGEAQETPETVDTEELEPTGENQESANIESKEFNWRDSEDEDALIEYGTSIGIDGLDKRCTPSTLRARIEQHLEASQEANSCLMISVI